MKWLMRFYKLHYRSQMALLRLTSVDKKYPIISICLSMIGVSPKHGQMKKCGISKLEISNHMTKQAGTILSRDILNMFPELGIERPKLGRYSQLIKCSFIN